ncbi:MAG: hypothetical protein H7070_09915 [Saprospiraceae bacterium]|nr:hypothetical protein [Pyrinomonadaceae bacterium]
MKRCPKCSIDYFDNLLEFCLDDGTKLVPLSSTAIGSTPVTKPNPAAPTIAGSSPFPFSASPKTLEFRPTGETETVVHKANKIDLTEPMPIPQRVEILETVPIVLALAHNWWQWLYLEKEYVSSIASYLISANFLMWLLLLIGGVAISLLALKKSERKTFAYTSLVILAINLILFLVPRR